MAPRSTAPARLRKICLALPEAREVVVEVAIEEGVAIEETDVVVRLPVVRLLQQQRLLRRHRRLRRGRHNRTGSSMPRLTARTAREQPLST